MDNIHGALFTAYHDICTTITAQLYLMTQDNDPVTQLDRARVVRKLAQAVTMLGHTVVVAEDQVREYNPLTEVES